MEKEKEELAATAEQKCLISIAEGVLLLRNVIKYTILSSQMSFFEVAIDPRVKVISVEGLKNLPVKRWEVVPVKENQLLRVSASIIHFGLIIV